MLFVPRTFFEKLVRKTRSNVEKYVPPLAKVLERRFYAFRLSIQAFVQVNCALKNVAQEFFIYFLRSFFSGFHFVRDFKRASMKRLSGAGMKLQAALPMRPTLKSN